MPTIGEAVDWLEAELFVGRERELALFERWLNTEAERPEILNVSGRGGIGKSALLRAFARAATRMGKAVVLVDGRDFPPTRCRPSRCARAESSSTGRIEPRSWETKTAAPATRLEQRHH
ncbi:MAG: AAA family ATPase [Chloroflexi bacterium]|nr:AAA family ATPase [Chloroflexota bacterium]